MTLIESYDELISRLHPHFSRIETFEKARALAYSHLVTYGRHTISRMICGKNHQQDDWSADYKFFSLRKWDAHDLYFEILKETDHHSHWYRNGVLVALDESFRKKTGKKIPKVSTLRDPMSLPFHTNLTPAIRFLQASAIINPEDRMDTARAIPVYFEEAAPAKKPKKKAPEHVKAQYKKEQKVKRISVKGHEALFKIRNQVDKLPNGTDRLLFMTVDGSFCNRNFLRDIPENIPHTGRGRRKIYGDRLPTPDEIRRDDSYEWKTERIFATGK